MHQYNSLFKGSPTLSILDNAIKNNRSSDFPSILIVDDNIDILRILQRGLRENGLRVSAFTDPNKALESLSTNSEGYGLILSDIRMPHMNGYELIRKAKQIDKLVKVVLMTAYDIDDREFHDLLSDIKIDDFLQKPFSMAKLNDVIAKISIMK